MRNNSLHRARIAGRFVALFAFFALTASILAPEKAQAEAPTIIVFGDSLVAGYQLPAGEGFPDQLQQALDEKGVAAKIVGAGVSGDTTSSGLARLDWSIGDDADAVILELGANDALRGLPPVAARKNLDAMLNRLTERGLPVLLAGMLAPPNMGADYGEKFNSIYPDLAEKYGVALYPFFLDGVAANPALNMGDGIHPTKQGVALIVEKILPQVVELIQKASEGES